jgi:hypothetical protein
MLNIFHVVLGVLKQLQKPIELRDRDRARKLWRCSSSVVRATTTHLAQLARRSGCLEVAATCSYVHQEPSLHDQLDRIVATLVSLVAR